jgi:hypothetical protein
LIASKSSHGRDALLRQIAAIEHDCELEEPQSFYDDRPRPPRPGATREHDSGETEEHDEATHAQERAIA